MTSRVVPGTGDTMAAGRCANSFSKLLLPAFGGPTMANLVGSTTKGQLNHARWAVCSALAR